jgi:hypothetical protein
MWLNPTLDKLVVYASAAPLPVAPATLTTRRLARPYLGGSLPRWIALASAQRTPDIIGMRTRLAHQGSGHSSTLPRLSGWWPHHGLGILSTQPQAIEVMAEAARLRVGGPQLIWQRGEAITQLFAAFEWPAYAAACDFGNFRDR